MNNYFMTKAIDVIDVISVNYPNFPKDERLIEKTIQWWARAFEAERLNDNHIHRGLTWVRLDSSRTHPPVGKFLEWCKTETQEDRERKHLSQIENRKARELAPPATNGKETLQAILRDLSGIDNSND